MKKFFSLFLTVIMLVSLCGCFSDSNTEEEVRGEITSESQNEIETEDEAEFSLGKSTGNTYKNDFLGISCTLPKDWEFYSDEQILELNNIVGDVVDEDIAEQIANANIIYDMYAICQADNSNMNINLEKLTTAQVKNLDIKETLEAQFDMIEKSYEDMGYSDIKVEYQKIKVDGQEFDGTTIEANIQGIDFYATMFAFRKGNYLANVTICSFETEKTDTILSYFTVE